MNVRRNTSSIILSIERSRATIHRVRSRRVALLANVTSAHAVVQQLHRTISIQLSLPPSSGALFLKDDKFTKIIIGYRSADAVLCNPSTASGSVVTPAAAEATEATAAWDAAVCVAAAAQRRSQWGGAWLYPCRYTTVRIACMYTNAIPFGARHSRQRSGTSDFNTPQDITAHIQLT